jgi:hypothetical protein
MREHRDPSASATTEDPQAAKSAKPGASTLPYRDQMEAAFGQDFSSVQVSTGKDKGLGAIGATGAQKGESVSFAEANPSQWLVAHELTHVVQQRGAGGAPGKGTIASATSAPEVEASKVADRVAAGEPAGDVSARPVAEIHRFAPGAHQEATVGGLAKTFSAEEIGDIYTANWERDFSQGNADIASAVISWSGVKNHAKSHNGDPGPTAKTFQDAVWKVVNGSITDATAESLGNYKYWEHMDHPTATFSSPDKAADKRWDKKANGLRGYINDSKAHIKDQMLAAVDLYRELHHLGMVGNKIDNWNGVAKPEGYGAPVVAPTKDGGAQTTLPTNWDDKSVASRDPIRKDTFNDATAAGAKSNASHNSGQWQLIGQHLGRAMHAFEDFWAHSNWLELAKEAHAKADKGEKVETGAAANAKLKTGTFEMPAKAHALGHKLLALASALQKDFALLLKVYGRTTASTKIDDDAAKKTRSTQWGGNGVMATNDHELAYNALKTDSWSTVGEISDVGDAVNNVEELVLSGKYKMEDFLCNQNWLEAVKHKGEILIQQGDANSDADSHGKLAKDQPEGDGHKDHGGALEIAKAANEKVFGPLRAVMDEKDPAKALASTQTQLGMVDTMLEAPSPSHPLWGLVDDH